MRVQTIKGDPGFQCQEQGWTHEQRDAQGSRVAMSYAVSLVSSGSLSSCVPTGTYAHVQGLAVWSHLCILAQVIVCACVFMGTYLYKMFACLCLVKGCVYVCVCVMMWICHVYLYMSVSNTFIPVCCAQL
jgi:cytochrome c oxidase subunit IV